MAMKFDYDADRFELESEPESEDEAFDTEPNVELPEDIELKRLHATIRNRSTLPNPPFEPIPRDDPARASIVSLPPYFSSNSRSIGFFRLFFYKAEDCA
jgi:hypothetical protein